VGNFTTFALTLKHDTRAFFVGLIARQRNSARNLDLQPCQSREVSSGLLTAAAAEICGVRFTPKSGHVRRSEGCPLWAKSGQSVLQQERTLFDHLVCALQE
jgi:hypothetical protein